MPAVEAAAASPSKGSMNDGDIIELDSDDDEDMSSANNAQFQSWYSEYLHKLERQYPAAFDLTIKEALSNSKEEGSANRRKAVKMALGKFVEKILASADLA